MEKDVITVTYDDLQSRKVDTRLKEQDALARNRAYAQMREENVPQAPAAKARPSIWYNATFTLAVFGLVGGLLAWGLATLLQFKPSAEAQANELRQAVRELTFGLETSRLSPAQQMAVEQIERQGRKNQYYKIAADPTMSDAQKQAEVEQLRKDEAWKAFFANVLAYGLCGMLIALALSVAEPTVDRNVPSVIINGSIGATLGLAGGVVVALFVDRLFRALGGELVGTPLSSANQIIARSVTWGVMGLFLTIGPAVVMKNFRRLVVGLTGGLLGGLIGGALYEPVFKLSGQAAVGQLVALLAIGLLAGVATGLIENAAKKGWVRVIAGVIAGKQFILYRNPTFIGSSPDCQIYLFKDKKVGRRHAAIHIVKGGFEIEDLPLGASTVVNNKPVKRTRLRHGDRVTIGATCFLFQEKAQA